jgi:hypothetical protein
MNESVKNVRSMTGGIDARSLDVDAAVTRYEVAPDPTHDKAIAGRGLPEVGERNEQ